MAAGPGGGGIADRDRPTPFDTKWLGAQANREFLAPAIRLIAGAGVRQ